MPGDGTLPEPEKHFQTHNYHSGDSPVPLTAVPVKTFRKDLRPTREEESPDHNQISLFTLNKIECFTQAACSALNILAWDKTHTIPFWSGQWRGEGRHSWAAQRKGAGRGDSQGQPTRSGGLRRVRMASRRAPGRRPNWPGGRGCGETCSHVRLVSGSSGRAGRKVRLNENRARVGPFTCSTSDKDSLRCPAGFNFSGPSVRARPAGATQRWRARAGGRINHKLITHGPEA